MDVVFVIKHAHILQERAQYVSMLSVSSEHKPVPKVVKHVRQWELLYNSSLREKYGRKEIEGESLENPPRGEKSLCDLFEDGGYDIRHCVRQHVCTLIQECAWPYVQACARVFSGSMPVHSL